MMVSAGWRQSNIDEQQQQQQVRDADESGARSRRENLNHEMATRRTTVGQTDRRTDRRRDEDIVREQHKMELESTSTTSRTTTSTRLSPPGMTGGPAGGTTKIEREDETTPERGKNVDTAGTKMELGKDKEERERWRDEDKDHRGGDLAQPKIHEDTGDEEEEKDEDEDEDEEWSEWRQSNTVVMTTEDPAWRQSVSANEGITHSHHSLCIHLHLLIACTSVFSSCLV